ncbi:MAG: sigma-70 family RNA polymerase sigma factor [Actinobacteria bacterium]|nr:sigma-70 family RNA polymerase sigma factor [Actinomycetota bacterium]
MDELTSLLIAARDGDRLALGAFIRSTQAEVWRLARHLVSDDEAEDVTQDVYVRAWRALPDYRGDASARTWLLAIARRACADAVRKRARTRRLRARLEAQPVRSTTAAPTTDIDALVAVLPPERREAFVLTQVVGCSYEEAAAIAGVPVGTIRSRVARAREALVEAVRAAEAV